MKKLITLITIILCFQAVEAKEDMQIQPQTSREIEYMRAVQYFNQQRNEYFSLTPLEVTRENIRKAQAKAEQCRKNTFGLIEDCDFAFKLLFIIFLSLLFLMGLYRGIIRFKLIEKTRLYLKHRKSKHSLDDIFASEKKK